MSKICTKAILSSIYIDKSKKKSDLYDILFWFREKRYDSDVLTSELNLIRNRNLFAGEKTNWKFVTPHIYIIPEIKLHYASHFYLIN